MPFDSKEYNTIARRMLTGFGPNGEKWCGKTLATPDGKTCLVGRFLDVVCGIPLSQMIDAPYTYQGLQGAPAFRFLEEASGTVGLSVFGIARKNDRAWARRDFSEIRRILERMHELEIGALTENAHAV